MADAHPVRRALKVGSHGLDVEALQRETDQRLDARGQDEFKTGGRDGVLGERTARGVSRALYLLGAMDATWEAAKKDNGGHVSIGGQRMIRHPGTRSPEQLDRARKRLAAVVRAEAASPNVAGIRVATAAARLALAHAPSVHYTQGPLRWQGIANRLVAAKGSYPNFADCSSFYTWCLWQILGGGPDVVNGAAWRGGFTGTLLSHGRRVGEGVEGAAVLYGIRGTTGKHVAYSLGNGQVISHGSEGGPFLLPIRYRSDLMDIRAYH